MLNDNVWETQKLLSRRHGKYISKNNMYIRKRLFIQACIKIGYPQTHHKGEAIPPLVSKRRSDIAI